MVSPLLLVAPILFGWLFTIGACYATGVVLLRLLRIECFRQEAHFFRLISGAVCFSLLIFLLTALHLAYAGVFVAAGCLIGAAAWLGRRSSLVHPPLPAVHSPYRWWFHAAIAVFGTYYFVYALAPETSPDGSTYHLGIAARYLRQHSFGHITTQLYANLSQGVDLLFLVAYSLGRHSSAALVEFTFLLALPFGMLSYARRVHHPVAGVCGALLVFASPLFGISGSVAYNDAAGTAILFALFYLLQIWAETRRANLVPLIGLVAGFCYAAKYTLFLALPFAGLFLLWHLWRSKRPWLRPLLVYAACALIMVAPWMAKNWLTVGNPFSPFANRLFPNPNITIQFEQQYAGLMRNPEGLPPRDRPIEHILLGTRSSGLLGPVFLLAPLALLALRFTAGRQVLLAALIFILPSYANVESRFLMPMAPFLSLALGLVLAQIPVALPAVLLFHLVTSWPTAIPAYAGPHAWRLEAFRPAEAFRLVPERVTLQARLPEIAIAELIERTAPPDARVFAFGNPPEAYTSREILVKYESALGNRLGEVLWTASLPDFQQMQTLTFSLPANPVTGVRLVQNAFHATDVWSISELQLFEGTIPVPRSALARLDASVNSWTKSLAVDGTAVTCWSTAQPIRPGMSFAVHLDRPRAVSQLRVTSPVEWAPKISLEVEETPGHWHRVPGSATREERRVPESARRDAILELKRNGVTHLLLNQDDFGENDYFTKQSVWGIELVGEAHGNRLYRLL